MFLKQYTNNYIVTSMVSAGRLCRPSTGITAAAIQVKKSKLEVVTRKTGVLSSVGFRAARVASHRSHR